MFTTGYSKITRGDTAKSKWLPEIAQTLGISYQWLAYGQGNKDTGDQDLPAWAEDILPSLKVLKERDPQMFEIQTRTIKEMSNRAAGKKTTDTD